jgi:dephospho-CoA kinase
MAIVVGLTGHAGCGKGTAAAYLKEKHGFDWIVFSDIIKEEAAKRGLLKGKSLEAEKLALSKFGNDWRKETGWNDVAARKIIERIRKEKMQKVAVDGFRSVEEVELFRKTFKGFLLVRIETPADARWKRRLEQDPRSKKEDFEARDKADLEIKGLDKVLKMADITIDNSGTKEELFQRMDEVLEEL